MRRLATIGIAVIMLAACDGGAGDPGTTGAPGTTTAPDTTLPSADATITISGFSFGPQLTVSVGDVVAVTNDDAAAHTWTSTDDLFDSGSLSGTAIFTHTFDQPGEYDFFCKIHPGDMMGSIIVEA